MRNVIGFLKSIKTVRHMIRFLLLFSLFLLLSQKICASDQSMHVYTFTDNLGDCAKLNATSGAIAPWTVFGRPDWVGIFSNGGLNYIQYRFVRPANYTRDLSAKIDVAVYAESYNITRENFSLSYSFDNINWIELDRVNDSERLGAGTHLTGSVNILSNKNYFYIRIGGQTIIDNPAWLGYVDMVTIDFLPKDKILRAEAGASFSDGMYDISNLNKSNGIICPWSVFGKPDRVGIFSDGAFNYIEYVFDKPTGYSTALTASINARVYGESYLVDKEKFSIYYSFDGITWNILDTLNSSSQLIAWAQLKGDINMGNNNRLFIRIGGYTRDEGVNDPRWLGYIDHVQVNFAVTRTGFSKYDVGTNVMDNILGQSFMFGTYGAYWFPPKPSNNYIGLFSDGAFNYVEYRFDRKDNYDIPMTLNVTAGIYGESFDSNEEDFSIYYSFDGEEWTILRSLTKNEQLKWFDFSSYITLWPGQKSLFVRIGGCTRAGGPGWIGYICGVNMTWIPLPVKNIRNYGAVGNSTNNDREAIQRSIDALPESGGIVYFPAGKYLVNDSGLTLKSNVILSGDGEQSIMIKGKNYQLLANGNNLRNIGINNLRFEVEPSTEAEQGEKRFIYISKSINIQVFNSTFDSYTLMKSTPYENTSLFSHLSFILCDGVAVYNNNFKNTSGNFTGMNGDSADPNHGKNGYFAYNILSNYVDTGIGLWTGAFNSRIYNNLFLGDTDGQYPSVAIDVDGGKESKIAGNIIARGQIGIRLYDSHNGAYKISNVKVQDNIIHSQTTGIQPAMAIRIETDGYNNNTDALFQRNEISSLNGFFGGSSLSTSTILRVENNWFWGSNFWALNWFYANTLHIFDGNTELRLPAYGSNKVFLQ